MFFGEPLGQTWLQVAELGLAFVLSALIGLEREFRQKSAGLRTYTLVGLASALIILISKYGFTDILKENRVVLDPSRIAAQIVSGIGFIGGGVIFLRKDLVRGLTTAATVLADFRSRDGLWSGAANSRHRRHWRPFRGDRAISGDRATPPKVTLGADFVSDFLLGRPGHPKRNSLRLLAI